jgi:D-alanyl-D-alanine carboxypeptidase
MSCPDCPDRDRHRLARNRAGFLERLFPNGHNHRRPRIGTRSPLNIARKLPSVAVAAALLLIATPALPAVGVPALVSLTTSSPAITAGAAVKLTGAVGGDQSCLALRDLTLQWEAGDSGSWADVATGTTADDGTFAFVDGPSYSGAYRVILHATASCQEATSDPVQVQVQAFVDISSSASSLAAGSCTTVQVSVTPAKPGQSVLLQQLSGTTWRTVQTLALDASSSGTARFCFAWDDIGVVRLRPRWPAQDAENAAGTGIVLALHITKAGWMQEIDRLTADRTVSVSVGDDGSFLYRRDDTVPRIPASNEKLLLSMALLDTLGQGFRIETHAAAMSIVNGEIPGNLWILGRGDPEMSAARLAALAEAIKAAGVTKVDGRVIGSTTYFGHDWWATGWKRGESRQNVGPPTALSFDENWVNHGFTREPELFAARSLTKQLEQRGVHVAGKPGRGVPPTGLSDVAVIRSPALPVVLTRMNRRSDNFYAEVLGKLLGVQTAGPPGTIAKGASVLRAWVAAHGASFALHDGSGLSYANRATALGVVRLLWVADGSAWGPTLRGSLATGGQGTLADRLSGVKVRAKTGTLDGVSALSGWVWLEQPGSWAEFSILSRGMDKWVAAGIEDRIVRIITNDAH